MAIARDLKRQARKGGYGVLVQDGVAAAGG